MIYNYPGSQFEYEDQSDIVSLPVEEPVVRPVFMAAFTSDKGPEEYTMVSGKKFFDLYGKNISFARHGQPLLQAANIINSGGMLFAKRVVASDATLASLAIIAEIYEDERDVDGQADAQGNPTKVKEKYKRIAYRVEKLTGVKSLQDAKKQVQNKYSELANLYPLYVFVDTGRGVSNKTISISPDYPSSKTVDYTRYKLNVYENDDLLESIQFGLHPYLVDNGTNVSLESRVKTTSEHIKCAQFDDKIVDFIEKATTEVYVDDNALTASDDLLFGLNKSGKEETNTSLVDLRKQDGGNEIIGYAGLAEIGFFNIDSDIDLAKNYNVVVPEQEFTIIDIDGDPATVNVSAQTKSITIGSGGSVPSVTLDASGLKNGSMMSGTIRFAIYEVVDDVQSKEPTIAEADHYINEISVIFNTSDDPASAVKSEAIDYINISEALALTGGSNGVFNDTPVAASNATAYETQLTKAFQGRSESGGNNVVYDVDSYKIDAIVDANYPVKTKHAIEALVGYRQDAFFFRDLGTEGLTSVSDITTANSTAIGEKGDDSTLKFTASYHNYYDIIDPYTKRQITVTIGYSLARLLVNHFNGGRNRPFAGLLHGATIPEAIEGTINFLPAVGPGFNEKEELSDARINYVSLLDGGVPVIETTYTSQERYSQFSFINNILAIQEAVKAVRNRLPYIRYSFADGEDLEKYKKDVNEVLNNYSNNFMSLTLEYIGDANYISNKIFYAAIKAQFKNFIQTEYFKVIALPS